MSIVVSLFDYSAEMVQPWAEQGFECFALDIKHKGVNMEEVGQGTVTTVECDLRHEVPEDHLPNEDVEIVFAFPPCTNLAVSGARWFKQKGLSGLADAIELVEAATNYCRRANAPYMIENPISTLSTYWRKPDYTFHPYEYDGFTEADEAYSKKTCLWTGYGFTMPEAAPADEYDDRIHKMAPSEDRSERRSMTPTGFAQAVFDANYARSKN